MFYIRRRYFNTSNIVQNNRWPITNGFNKKNLTYKSALDKCDK